MPSPCCRLAILGLLLAPPLAAAAATPPSIAAAGWTAEPGAGGGWARIAQGGDVLLDSPPELPSSLVRRGVLTALPGSGSSASDAAAIDVAGVFPSAATGLGSDLEVTRRACIAGAGRDALTLLEELTLRPGGQGAEVRVPFQVRLQVLRLPVDAADTIFLPRKDGRGLETVPGEVRCASYVLGEGGIDIGCVPLALPLIDLPLAGGRRLALFTDPLFTTGFGLRLEGDTLAVSLGWKYSADRVPFRGHERRIYAHVHSGPPFAGLDALLEHEGFSAPLPWLERIGLVHFDYLADGGDGWFRDLDALADRIPAADRDRVAVALHGWYDRIGAYAYDAEADAFRPNWPALPGRYGAAVEMSVAEVRRRLAHARALGFRTLLYFADGTTIDSSEPRSRFNVAELGLNPWTGPEVVGHLCIQNPADPEVRRWFHRYLAALLGELGAQIDGLVWDETFWVRPLAIATVPEPAYAAPAMMTLVHELARETRAYREDLAFLVSDAPGYNGIDSPPNALLAHGTFQDSECEPRAWSHNLFPSWRKPLWSVLWGARRDFEAMRLGVLAFGAPVSLSNGWADDLGPAELPDEISSRAFELFERGLAPRPPFLVVEPRAYLARPLPGDLAIDCWQATGIFPNQDDHGLEAVFPPERDGGGAAWRDVPAEAGGFVDLGAALGPGEKAVAYARTVVLAPEGMAVDLVAGSHDGLKVWIEGRQVLAVHRHRAHVPGTDVVRNVRLRQGENRILVKAERTAGGFGFSLSLQDAGQRRLECAAAAPASAGAPHGER